MSDPLARSGPGLPLEARRRIADVCARFDEAWTAGRRPALEEFLPPDGPPEERRELLKALLEVELHCRRQDGRPLTADEAAERFAGLGPWAAEVLRELALETPDEALLLDVIEGP